MVAVLLRPKMWEITLRGFLLEGAEVVAGAEGLVGSRDWDWDWELLVLVVQVFVNSQRGSGSGSGPGSASLQGWRFGWASR